MSIFETLLESLSNYAENGVTEAIIRYKKTKRDCILISVAVFLLCILSLLLKAFVF